VNTLNDQVGKFLIYEGEPVTWAASAYGYAAVYSPRVITVSFENIATAAPSETFWLETNKPVSSFPYPIILEELSDKRFFLKHEIKISIDIEGNGYILSSDDLNVYAFGEMLFSAQREWENVLIDLYLSYRETPDDHLAVSGKALKDRLQEVIGERNAD